MTRKNAPAGFTLVELIVVVAIIGILAAIGIAAYTTALDRARQKRTASDIRIIGSAWEARAIDLHTYLIAGYTFPTDAVAFGNLAESLTPTYARNLPEYDGWGQPLEFGAGPDRSRYAIRSPGRDGTYEGTAYTPGETANPDCDIVFADGSFIRYPAGVQGK